MDTFGEEQYYSKPFLIIILVLQRSGQHGCYFEIKPKNAPWICMHYRDLPTTDPKHIECDKMMGMGAQY